MLICLFWIYAAFAAEIRSTAFAMKLDVTDGLHAVSFENRLAHRTLNLGKGSELEVDLDQATRRIGITGWRFAVTQPSDAPPDNERGFISGAARKAFDDSGWTTVMTPNVAAAPSPGYAWGRRTFSLRASERGQTASFTLGGFGLFDYALMRVFLNGQLIGERDKSIGVREPLRITLRPDSAHYKLLNFEGENLLALQLGEYNQRLARLDAADPEKRWDLSRFYWPPTFEQIVTVGDGPRALKFKVVGVSERPRKLIVTLRDSEAKIQANVSYTCQSDGTVLRKTVELMNQGTRAVRILNVGLGNYSTSAQTTQGEQGHPVYADDCFFFGLAHPAGWSTADGGGIRLHQHPGTVLEAGKSFECFETVYGVSRDHDIAGAFVEHIRSRMRRVIRKHDQPYAFYESFGSDAEKDKYDAREDRVLPAAAAMNEFTRETGCHFDAFSIEFWEDLHGDRSAPDPSRFPNGFGKIRQTLAPSRTPLGLWVDITGPDQSIGLNPAVAPALNFDPAFGTERRTMCLVTDPMPAIDRRAFVKQVRDGVRLLKFDGYWAACRNNVHGHLSGIYATEAIDSAFIQLLNEIDQASPDCFFELYGGYHSPWWLLYADTIYESGIAMEAATPGPWPTLWARDGVTRVLDQATQFSREDVPALGKDSLGVWLSDWKWNSGIGSERWQAGFVMDLMRGSMLAQPWCDLSKLNDSEGGQLAQFIGLLRAAPKCFDRTRLVVGSPWKNEPYGWCGTDGRRAYIALNNGTWKDRQVPLELNEKWGLPAGKKWQIYRRWPDPARLTGDHSEIALRPFEIVLLEAVVAGEKPLLGTSFVDKPIPSKFAEPSRELEIQRENGDFVIAVPAMHGYLAITTEVRTNGLPCMRTNAGSHWKLRSQGDLRFVPVLAREIYYKSSWQAWRAEINSRDPRKIRMNISADAPAGAQVDYKAYLIPN